MTFEELAKMTAKQVNKEIEEENKAGYNFDNFNDMAQCYMWDAQDIKEYIGDIIEEFGAYIDEEDGKLVFLPNDDCISYRKFIGMVRKELKAEELDDED